MPDISNQDLKPERRCYLAVHGRRSKCHATPKEGQGYCGFFRDPLYALILDPWSDKCCTMPRGKHYVVFLRRAPGIYGSWSECQRQVIGFSGNSYQSYPTRAEAEDAFQAFHRAQGAICVTGAQEEAERGKFSGALKDQGEKASTSDDKFKETENLALIIGSIVLVCAVLIKILA